MNFYQELLDENLIEEISPSEMVFQFELSREECHLKYAGVCSLDIIAPYRGEEISGDANLQHCRQILRSIRREGITEHIDIVKYKCGHHAFTDGQHRVCIAKRKGLKLDALIEIDPASDCDICRNKAGEDSELG